jgi:hypothetical protein
MCCSKELPTENLGEAGEEPSPETTNTVAVLMSQGRPPAVVLVLIKTLADVVEHTLQVRRQDVHLVVFEEPFRNVGEARIPMEPPRIPHWY